MNKGEIMEKEIDVRGLSCPLPVVTVKQAIDRGEGEILVRLNEACSVDNVMRLARNSGYEIDVIEAGEEIVLRLVRK